MHSLRMKFLDWDKNIKILEDFVPVQKVKNTLFFLAFSTGTLVMFLR